MVQETGQRSAPPFCISLRFQPLPHLQLTLRTDVKGSWQLRVPLLSYQGFHCRSFKANFLASIFVCLTFITWFLFAIEPHQLSTQHAIFQLTNSVVNRKTNRPPFFYWQQLILDQDTVLLDHFHQQSAHCKCNYPSYKRTSHRHDKQ